MAEHTPTLNRGGLVYSDKHHTRLCARARLEVPYLDGISCSHTVPWKSIYTRVVHNAFKVYKSFTALYSVYIFIIIFFFFLPLKRFIIIVSVFGNFFFFPRPIQEHFLFFILNFVHNIIHIGKICSMLPRLRVTSSRCTTARINCFEDFVHCAWRNSSRETRRPGKSFLVISQWFSFHVIRL
jgi:hypothetical protein